MLGSAVGAEEHLKEERDKSSQSAAVALTTKHLEMT